MSNYNYKEPRARKKKSSRLQLWDLLSMLILIVALCVGLYFVAIFLMPNSAFNPFPPAPPNLNLPPQPTITAIQLEPTWTLTPANVTETPTLLPTFTLQPSPTIVSLVTPSITPTPTKTPKAQFSINVNQGISSTNYYPELGCNWQGFAGTVVGPNNEDLPGYIILLNGFYKGKTYEEYKASGIAQNYGRSGFEFQLGSAPIETKGLLYIQLFKYATGLPVSEKKPIDTFSECEKNLVIIRFKENP